MTTPSSDLSFWKNRRVLITGQTGFKGSWLTLLLLNLGANVYGISLPPASIPGKFRPLYESLSLDFKLDSKSFIGDIRDRLILEKVLLESKPEIVFHLAAQSLVKRSYLNPIYTWETNTIGTLNILESLKELKKKLDLDLLHCQLMQQLFLLFP